MFYYILIAILLIIVVVFYLRSQVRFGVNNVTGIANYPIVGSILSLPDLNGLAQFFVSHCEKFDYKVC
jgi:hypothetical protein